MAEAEFKPRLFVLGEVKEPQSGAIVGIGLATFRPVNIDDVLRLVGASEVIGLANVVNGLLLQGNHEAAIRLLDEADDYLEHIDRETEEEIRRVATIGTHNPALLAWGLVNLIVHSRLKSIEALARLLQVPVIPVVYIVHPGRVVEYQPVPGVEPLDMIKNTLSELTKLYIVKMRNKIQARESGEEEEEEEEASPELEEVRKQIAEQVIAQALAQVL